MSEDCNAEMRRPSAQGSETFHRRTGRHPGRDSWRGQHPPAALWKRTCKTERRQTYKAEEGRYGCRGWGLGHGQRRDKGGVLRRSATLWNAVWNWRTG